MKNYRDSDYAVNKYAAGIVYRFADKTVEVTLKDFLRENPDKTEEDFAELKAMSDEIFLEQVRRETAHGRKTTPFYLLDESLLASESLEDSLFDPAQRESDAKRRKELTIRALNTLTKTQLRRYLLYYVNGLSMRKIADMESVAHSKIQKSLQEAEKKIKKVSMDD
jgi:DNA-directed RNA polymerase specialized sigma subunit